MVHHEQNLCQEYPSTPQRPGEAPSTSLRRVCLEPASAPLKKLACSAGIRELLLDAVAAPMFSGAAQAAIMERLRSNIVKGSVAAGLIRSWKLVRRQNAKVIFRILHGRPRPQSRCWRCVNTSCYASISQESAAL